MEPRQITFEEIAELDAGSIITPSEGEFWPGGATVPLAVTSLDVAARTMDARTGVTEQNPHGTASVTVAFPPAQKVPEEPAEK